MKVLESQFKPCILHLVNTLNRVLPPQGARVENMSMVSRLMPFPFILKLRRWHERLKDSFNICGTASEQYSSHQELVVNIHILNVRDLALKQQRLDLSGDTTGSPLETAVKSSQVLTSSLLQLRGSLDSDPNLTRSARSLVCFLSFLLANSQDVILISSVCKVTLSP